MLFLSRAALTVRLSPQPARVEELTARFRAELEQLVGLPGLVGAHLLRADEAASRVPPREKERRAQPDTAADWVEKAIDERDHSMQYYLRFVIGRRLRLSPRWPKVARMSNIPDDTQRQRR